MSIAGRLEANAQADRRGTGRRELRLWLDMRHGSDHATDALVLNISESGLLFRTAMPLSPSDTLQVDLPQAGFLTASVVWTSGEFVGCRFVRPLSPAIVSAAQLRSDPSRTDAVEPAEPAPAESFGQRLRRLRKHLGLTQPALARLIGVSKLTVWKWERGDARPRHRALRALAEVFSVPESALLLGTPVQAETDPAAGSDAVVDECKARIAEHLGISAHRIEITVRL